MSPLPIRIAILDTALVQPPRIRAKYGNMANAFSILLHTAADALDLPRDRLKLSAWDVANGKSEGVGVYPTLSEVDAVLITGSRVSAFDTTPWVVRLVEFVKEILAQDRVRVIGVCFGHQVVALALGATVARNVDGWEVSVCEMDLTEKGKELLEGKDVLSIIHLHRDNVYGHLSGVEILGSSPKCAVQGMYISKKLITIQGHPEMNEEIIGEILEVRRALGIFDNQTFQDAIARVGKAHDGVLVAKAFLRFMMET